MSRPLSGAVEDRRRPPTPLSPPLCTIAPAAASPDGATTSSLATSLCRRCTAPQVARRSPRRLLEGTFGPTLAEIKSGSRFRTSPAATESPCWAGGMCSLCARDSRWPCPPPPPPGRWPGTDATFRYVDGRPNAHGPTSFKINCAATAPNTQTRDRSRDALNSSSLDPMVLLHGEHYLEELWGKGKAGLVVLEAVPKDAAGTSVPQPHGPLHPRHRRMGR